ncbi:MAG: hypothetical protein J6X84_02120 [Treponema sp.]|nr:hypothetical protein [Treponema sp.]
MNMQKLTQSISNSSFKVKGMSKSHKFLVAIVAVFLMLDVIAATVLLLNKSKSAVRLVFGNQLSSLFALDSAAQKGTIGGDEYANFKFTENQKEYFYKIWKENGTVALTVCLQLMPTKNQKALLESAEGDECVFRYGFLGSEDFTERGDFIKKKYPDVKRIQIQGKEKNAPEIFDLSFAVQKNDNIEKYLPEGFFVYSSVRCRIMAACVVPAEIGFDVSKSIPFYGFACNGGVVDFKNSGFDFSGSSMVFPLQSSAKLSLPEYRIVLSENEEYKTTKERSIRVLMNVGGEKLYIKNVAAAREVIIPVGGLNSPFSRVDLSENKVCVNALIMRSAKKADSEVQNGEVLSPVRTDPGLILNYKQSQWRTLDYELYEWDRFPQILFFDTRNYDVQDRFFRRLAFFVEKQGYKGRLLSNEELGDMHGYNAHDYSASSIANFFNKATELGFQLNEEELLLKRILIHNGLLENNGVYVKANEGGLVSISQETPDWSRTNLLAHEGWHTIFFRDSEFRNFVSAVYYTFDPLSLEFLIDFFQSQPNLGYDINDEYLMHNEFMAYIMQNRLSEVGNYFVHLANRGTVINYTPELASYIRKTEARGFEDAANALNDFVFDKYGIVCGNIALVSRY